ncbi:MAG: N-methyl-L-tryptophan oxidase [Chloroflexi bacterium]|nr:N-methyl-L-tryptophan oxidase [Chloroflexota bacterium]
MGSAAAYHLARRGRRVLGLDRFAPPHALGSSHGETRIIREAYYEHPSYVPIVQRAYQLWAELEEEAGRRLFTQTGGLMIGPPDGELVTGAEHSARRYRLPYERLTASDVTRCYPALHPSEDMIAILDHRAGILFPEACVEANLQLARKNGATLHFDEPATSWQADGSGVRVTTAKGVYRADGLIIAAGAWAGDLLAGLNLPLTVERQVLFWLEPLANASHFSPELCPIYVIEYEGDRHMYGFPDVGGGVKAARMHQGETTSPNIVRREVGHEDEAPLRALLDRYLPDASGRLRKTEVCLFTNTPDRNFLIDRHPEHPQVIIASPCSGHGFKFASAIGEILADLLDSESAFDLRLFKLDRF